MGYRGGFFLRFIEFYCQASDSQLISVTKTVIRLAQQSLQAKCHGWLSEKKNKLVGAN